MRRRRRWDGSDAAESAADLIPWRCLRGPSGLLEQLAHRRGEPPSLPGQAVLGVRRAPRDELAPQNPGLLELLEALREGGRGNAGQRLAKLVEARRAARAGVD